MLVRQQDKKYEAELAKLRVTYAQWAAEQEKKISETVVTEIGERAGLAEFVIYRQQKGQLAENAVERINAYFVKHPEAEIVYGDEDLLSENGERVIPWFKPCWAPDTYRAFFYVGSVVAVRSRLLQKLGEPGAVTEGESTGREIVFSKAEEIRPLMDRLFLAAGGFERGCHTILVLRESDCRDRQKPAGRKRKMSRTPGKSTGRQRNPQNCPWNWRPKRQRKPENCSPESLGSL